MAIKRCSNQKNNLRTAIKILSSDRNPISSPDGTPPSTGPACFPTSAARSSFITEGRNRTGVVRMRKPPASDSSSAHTVKILSVSPSEADHAALREILQGAKPDLEMNCRWIVRPVSTVASTAEALAEEAIPIVISECNLPSGTWQTILQIISQVPEPPLLIVASRAADERLWAEALNLGAWDVLAKPFDTQEVMRVVAWAWRHWKDRHELPTEHRSAATET